MMVSSDVASSDLAAEKRIDHTRSYRLTPIEEMVMTITIRVSKSIVRWLVACVAFVAYHAIF